MPFTYDYDSEQRVWVPDEFVTDDGGDGGSLNIDPSYWEMVSVVGHPNQDDYSPGKLAADYKALMEATGQTIVQPAAPKPAPSPTPAPAPVAVTPQPTTAPVTSVAPAGNPYQGMSFEQYMQAKGWIFQPGYEDDGGDGGSSTQIPDSYYNPATRQSLDAGTSNPQLKSLYDAWVRDSAAPPAPQQLALPTGSTYVSDGGGFEGFMQQMGYSYDPYENDWYKPGGGTLGSAELRQLEGQYRSLQFNPYARAVQRNVGGQTVSMSEPWARMWDQGYVDEDMADAYRWAPTVIQDNSWDDGGDGGSGAPDNILRETGALAEFRAADSFRDPINKFLRTQLGVDDFDLYGSKGPLAFSEYRGYDGQQGNRLFDLGGASRFGNSRVLLTPSQQLARQEFLAKYPGYSQINPGVFRDLGGGNYRISNEGPGAGYWLSKDALQNAKYDPEFGLLVPTSSFGYAGQKGGLMNDSFGQGLLMLASAAAPFVGGYFGGVDFSKIGLDKILKGMAVGGGLGAATGGGDPGAIIKGIIGGATAPVSAAAAEGLLSKYLPNLATGLGATADNAIKSGLGAVTTGVLQNPANIANPTGLLTSFVGGAGADASGLNDLLSGTGEVGQDFEGTYTPDQELAALADTNAVLDTNTLAGFTPTGSYSQPGTAENLLGLDSGPNTSQFVQTPAPADAIGMSPERLLDLPITPRDQFQITPISGDAGLPTGEFNFPGSEEQDFEGEYTEEQDADALRDTAIAEQGVNYVRLAKTAWDAYKALTGDKGDAPAPYTAPPRNEGESDEQYTERVVEDVIDYVDTEDLAGLGIDVSGLDPEVLATQATPGTPEYLMLVLDELDRIIEAMFGADPALLAEGESIEGFQEAVRGKTDKEMQALQRALYARGQLGSLSSSGTGYDPFSRQTYDLGTNDMVDTNVGGYQRGVAEFAKNLGESGDRGLLDEFLDRKPDDLYGLRTAQKRRKKRDEMLLALRQDADRKRRRGEIDRAPTGDFFSTLFDARDPELLDFLARIGG